MSAPRILAFAGSARSASVNKKLLRFAAKAAEDAGGEVRVVDLKDYPMPIYNGDLEDGGGMPDTAREFKELLCSHDGFLVASPEYNSSISPLLKNALDWASRPEGDDEPALRAFQGKAAGIMAASPGRLGGLRGLVHLRAILGNIGVTVVPKQVAVGGASEAFDAEGNLKDDHHKKQARAIASDLVALAGWMQSQE